MSRVLEGLRVEGLRINGLRVEGLRVLKFSPCFHNFQCCLSFAIVLAF